MNPERWKKIEDIFQSALDLTGDEREEFIRAECGDDAELLAEVRKFIARYETEDTFLESPVWTDSLMMQPSLKHQIASSLEKEIPPTLGTQGFIGRQIGVYRLTAEIGKGGMGVVYAAERADGEFYQKVAIKLIKRGMDTDFIVKRFRHERQIAATLNHQNIARLLDGGTTQDDLPYFVMEFIEGEPLYRFCEKNNLKIPERLKLFQQICAAVSYAHGKQIVHRDIKPGNILISDEGTPKLLDFGIAKILDPNLIHESLMQTATQMRLMTPEYASPEQVRGEDITPASDQYSLGVLLYELVTGARPYTFPSRAPHEIARVICEEEPSRPSSADEPKVKANGRQKPNEHRAKDKVLVDETLERIILKSLRKFPSERYASVAEFAADIERYLTNQPIRAESFSTGKDLFPRIAAQKSIAVLPLKIINASAEGGAGDEEFLSVGLADALVTRLSNVRQFVVRPTSSVLSYGKEAIDALAAGEKLNVGFVLDGTLTKTERRIRVSVKLLNIAEQSTIWKENFDEELTDVLSLEDTISAKVAESLVPKLTGEERQRLGKGGTDNPKAHESFLRGRYHWNAFTEEGFRNSIVFYQKAIEIDPNYALAHAAIADYYVWLGMYGVLPVNEFYPPAKAAALRAIELDSRLSEAYAALGLIHLYGEYDWQTSESKILHAIKMNPNNSVAHLWYSHNLFTQGRFDDGARHIRRAIELDPLSFQNYNTFAWSKFFARDLDAALAEVEKLVEKFPLSALSYFGKSYFSAFVGKTEESLQAAKKALELSDDSLFNVYGYAQALAAAGRRAEVETLLDQARSGASKHHIFNYHGAVVYCLLKDKEKAFELLELSFDEHESVIVWLAIEPSLDILRDDARYFKLLEKLNHPCLKTIYKNLTEQKTLVKDFGEKSESSSTADKQKSIAVLPFRVSGGASDDSKESEFLGVGLADALITRLSNVRQFVVRPTSSILRFGKDTANSFTAGKELKVKYVLDGSILHADRQIRVSVQLLDVEAESAIWAERFNETFTDVLELEDVISAKVAESLVPQLTTGERENLAKRGTDNAEAYEAYLRGRFYWNTFTEHGFRQAIFYYQKAVEIDPTYALAYAGIADYYIWLGIYGVLSPKRSYQPAKEMAERAIEFDDRLAEAYAALGFAQLCGDFDWRASEKNMRRAIELSPNYAVAHNWLAIYLFTARRFDEGIEHARQAVELDPLTYQNHRTLSWGFYFSRRFDECIAEVDWTIEKFPMFGVAYLNRAWVLRFVGDTKEAVRSSEKALEAAKDSIFVLIGHAQSLAADGQLEAAEKLIEEARQQTKVGYLSYYHIALVYCYAKKKETALDALEAAAMDNDGWLVWLAVEPALDFLRDEPRFIELSKKIVPFDSFSANDNRIAQNLSVDKIGDDSEKLSNVQADKIKTPVSAKKNSKSLKTDSDEKSIAVLPFKILNEISGAETGGEFLKIGLADALITRLSGIRQFVLRPTSSVLRYGEGDADSFAAGRELNVKFLLDGNIVKTDSRIRVSVQLLNVSENAVVWADRFDEDLTDFLELEDAISAKVVESLVPQLTTGEVKILAKRATDNAEAYEAYLRGRFHWNTFSEEGFRQAISFYQKAVELDPTYALAYAGIADYYIWLGVYGVVPPKVCYPAAKDAARQAVALDDRLAEAYASLGFAQLCGDYDWVEAEKNVVRAIELNPHYAIARLWYSYVLQTAGRFDEGIRQARQAIEFDPLTYTNYHVLAWAYYFARRFDEAVEQVAANVSKFPEIGLAYFTRSWIERQIGRTAEAVKASEKALQLSGESLFVRLGHAQALASDGRRVAAEKLLVEIEAEGAKQYLSYYQIALVYCFLGEKEKALDALERTWSENEGWLIWLKVEPALDVLRGEPRFAKLLEQVHPSSKTQSKIISETLPQIVATPQAEISVQTERPRRMPAPLKYALAAIALALAASVFYEIVSHTTVDFSTGVPPPGASWRDSFSTKMSIKRLTSSGTAIASAISPDGRQIAFSLREAELQSLWIQPVDSGNAVQIVAPGVENYVGLTFSPDGEFIYYDTYNPTDAAWWLNRVAATGGTAQKILKGVYKNIGFAPGGKQIAYFSIDEKKQAINLQLTEIDADGAPQPPKTLATRVLPDHLIGNPSFSPDGKKIVYAAGDVSADAELVNLFVFNLETGTEEQIGKRNFNEITAIAWREYESEIVVSANEKNTEPLQLWLVAYPSGEMSRLTNDLNNYSGVSLTKNSNALVTAKKNVGSNISVVDLSAAKTIDDTSAKQITGGVDRQDGIKGINWTADGRIVYVANAGTEKTINLMNADGSNNQALNVGEAAPANPVFTRDNRYLFYVDEKEQESVIKRFEPATGALTQITSGLAATPVLSADNQFLVYTALNEGNKMSLHRISIDGGKPTELTSALVYRPAVSPDGRFIVCFFNSDVFSGKWEIAILNSNGGIPVNVIKPPDLANLQNPHERRLAWSPDSRSIFYINDKGGVSNVFRIPIEGNQPPEKITHFAAGRIFEFALAPDGKRAALARGSTSSDIVIFKNSK